MKLSVGDYRTMVFDCDGVVLDSNRVKTESFYQAALPYGEVAARALVDFHVANGGISRYKKFAHFLERIVPEYSTKQGSLNQDELVRVYASSVYEGLLSCDIASNVENLRLQTPNARWMIVSGGDQAELRDVFLRRGIADWFDGGIFGSPATKDEILAREQSKGNIKQPALFLGDSKYDYQAADAAGLDFLFLSGWSEVADWRCWVENSRLAHVESLQALVTLY